MIKVLSIGTDRKLFEEGSAVLERTKEYASRMAELHIIVFTLKNEGHSYTKVGNLHLYPTNSSTEWLYVLDAIRQGKKILKTSDFDGSYSVISTQDPFQTGFVGWRLSKKFKLPLQVQIHTDFLSPYFSGFFNSIRKAIASVVLPRADGIRVVNSVISDSIKKKFPNLKAKIEILSVFVDIEKIIRRADTYYEHEHSGKSILMVSRFTKEKRIDVGLEAFKKALATDAEIGLTIIGSGPEKENLKEKIMELKISDAVKILEWDNDVLSAYRSADIFLLTSEYEGYGMTLIESGASGCPIVTTEVGIAKTELFKNGENSFVCPVGDVECLSKSIIDLIEHPEKRKLFKERMQDSIKKQAISREQYIERYVGLLEDLLKLT